MKKTIFLIALFGMSYGVKAQDEVVNGNLAVGTSSRTDIGTLHVTSSNTSVLPVIRIESDANSDSSFIRFQAKNSSASNRYSDISFDPNTENLTFKNPHNSAERMTIRSNGNVGIGTTSPDSKLTVKGHVNIGGDGNYRLRTRHIDGKHYSSTLVDDLYLNYATGEHVLVGFGGQNSNLYVSGNTGIGTTSPIVKLDIEQGDLYVGEESSTNGNRRQIRVYGFDSNEKFYGSLHSNYDDNKRTFDINTNDKVAQIKIDASANSSANIILNPGASGSIGIGTVTPDSKLTVKGNIHAEEVKVDLSVPGPDYVFESDYNLTPLEDLQYYITENKHLPNIPSAKEMETNGIELGVMNMKLLEKIEELTLYTIQQEKQLKDKDYKIENLEDRLQKIETFLELKKQY